MQYLIPSVVSLLMISVGMSLKLTTMISRWRQISWGAWLRLLTATFLIPPALSLLLAHLFRLSPGETAGLFLVGVAPGAPLLTRNMARRGFDMHLAASYQVWAGLMVPVMLPIVVMAAGKLYGRDIWIPPIHLLKQIAVKQFLPLSVGMLFAWFAPKASQWTQPIMNVSGNILFTLTIIVILVKLGPSLKNLTVLTPVAAFLLAIGSMAAILLVRIKDALVQQTFAICNANRHVGLALLLSSQYVRSRNAFPAVVCYALIIPVIVVVYAKYFSASRKMGIAGPRWKSLSSP